MSHKAALRLTTATDGLTKLCPPRKPRSCGSSGRAARSRCALHTAIAARRAIAYTTVMTTCVRMAEKGLLHREKAGPVEGYFYTATIGERDFVTRELAQVLDSLVRDYPSALVHYLDTCREHATV